MTSLPISDLPWPRKKTVQSLIASSGAACVFIVGPEDGKPVHIGLSRIPRRRMWQLRSEIHRPTHIYGMTWALDVQAQKIAATARMKLPSKHLGGNWFDVNPQDVVDVIVSQTEALRVDTATHGQFLAAIDRQHEAEEAEYQLFWSDLDLNLDNRETLIQCLMDKQESMDEEEMAERLVVAMDRQIISQLERATS